MTQNLKIFLIDDCDSSNLYHKIMMEDAGININQQVKEFTSSVEAQKYLSNIYGNKLKKEFPDVILLDINMPQISGWEIVSNLEKELPINSDLKVYMVSNSRHPSDLERAKKHDIIQDIMEKHLNVDFFEKLLRES